MVHPKYHNCCIGEALFNLGSLFTKLFFPKNKTMLMTEIAVGNNPSLASSHKSGFKALKKYTAFDGVECFLLYKVLSKKIAVATDFDKKKSLVSFPIKKESKIKISEEEKNKIKNNFNNHIEKLLNITNINNNFNSKFLEELYIFQLANNCFSKKEKIGNYFIK